MFLLFGVVGSEWPRSIHSFLTRISVVFLFFLPRNKGVAYNVLVWVLLLVGLGLQSCIYFMEAYARKSCPANVNELEILRWIDRFIVVFRTQSGIKSFHDRSSAECNCHRRHFFTSIYNCDRALFFLSLKFNPETEKDSHTCIELWWTSLQKESFIKQWLEEDRTKDHLPFLEFD